MKTMPGFYFEDRNFAPRHRLDQMFYQVIVAIVWAAILSGFLYNNVMKYREGKLSYPWIVHVHAAAFFLWLILFTTQVILICRGSVALHRRLGWLGAALASIMVPLGVLTGIVTERLKFGGPLSDARFLIVMFADMAAFGSLVAAGILLRKSPSAHQRLMLVATLLLTDAGFGRWLSPAIGRWFGLADYFMIHDFEHGAWPFVRFQLLPAYTLIFAVGVYDLITRNRLNRAYVAGVACCLSLHLLAGWLYFQPFWNRIAMRIIGH